MDSTLHEFIDNSYWGGKEQRIFTTSLILGRAKNPLGGQIW